MPEQKDVTVVTSKVFSLNKTDFLKGLLMAVIGAVVGAVWGIVKTSLDMGSLTFDWQKIGVAALSAAGAAIGSYLSKNFFSPSQTIVKFDPPVEKPTTVTVTPSAEDAAKKVI